MTSLEMTHVVDIDYGRTSAVSDSDEASSVCFSDGDEGSCYSQFYSTADGSYDDYPDEIGEVPDSRRVSSASASDCSVDIENEVEVNLGKEERDCRICHLSLESDSAELGFAIELGCCCKDDLAAAHRQCAEAWFKIKGNKICEICNSIARNVTGASEVESMQQANETNSNTRVTNAASAPVLPATENQSCLNGHRFLNFLLACLVFAFLISWLFHVDIQS